MRKTSHDVLQETAERLNIRVETLKSPARRRPIAWPRQEVMYEIYVQCPHVSMPQIGRLLGHRDHTTVLHGIRAHCARRGIDYASIRRTGPDVFYLAPTPRRNPLIFVPRTAAEYREVVRA